MDPREADELLQLLHSLALSDPLIAQALRLWELDHWTTGSLLRAVIKGLHDERDELRKQLMVYAERYPKPSIIPPKEA